MKYIYFTMIGLSVLTFECYKRAECNAAPKTDIKKVAVVNKTIKAAEKPCVKPSKDIGATIVREEEVKPLERVYKVSEKGELLIKKHENLKLERYHCGREKFWTIGYGHRVLKGENYVTITEGQAERIFRADMDKVNASVNRLLKALPHSDRVVYSQGLVNAVGSLVYNCGEDGVRKSLFYKRLVSCRYDKKNACINKNDYDFTLVAIKDTNVYYKGHKTRRVDEYLMAMN